MNILDLAQSITPLKRKTATEWAGPCPECGGEDRFLVWAARGRWHCRGCGLSGAAVDLLRRFRGLKCHEAYAALGQACDPSACSVADNCPAGGNTRTRPKAKPLSPPPPAKDETFTPRESLPPAARWQRSAQKLIEHAHAALLACPEQLDYLAARGIPRAAVEHYRLGWIAADMYRPRSAWGLPAAISERTGRPKRLWLPRGILIPFAGEDATPERIRIRRPEVGPDEPRYYCVPGSGDDIPVLGPTARGFVVVESDLDGILVHWHASDLVGTIPLGSCSVKPRTRAATALEQALVILVALDFEPRINAKTGKPEAPGGQAAAWWPKHFPRARRWPVPAGKDPGEYVQDYAGDIRAWVMAGLPPALLLPGPAATTPAREPRRAEEHPPTSPAAPATADENETDYLRAVSKGGIPYLVARDPAALDRLCAQHPGHVPLTWGEIARLKNAPPEAAHALLEGLAAIKAVFPGANVIALTLARPEPTKEDRVWDMSRGRAARRAMLAREKTPETPQARGEV